MAKSAILDQTPLHINAPWQRVQF